MIRATVKVNVSGFDNFRKALKQGFENGGGGEIEAMFRKWGSRYLAFSRRRFKTLSGGGSVSSNGPGDQSSWPPLAASTLAQRAGKTVTRVNQAYKNGEISAGEYTTKLKAARARSRRQRKKIDAGKSKSAILIDTGTLFNALTIGMPGNTLQRIKNGVRVGIGGPGKHPTGKATIADIAEFHNTGGGNLPRRQIIAMPDNQTMDGMKNDLIVCITRLIASNKIKG